MTHGERNNGFKKRAPMLALAGVLLLLDQIVKYSFSVSERYFCNTRGPWGILADNELLAFLMAIVILIALFFFFRTQKRGLSAALILVLAGGVSNLIDRIVFGCVRDCTFVSWFPAFNLADLFLTMGAIVSLIALSGTNEAKEISKKD